MTKRIDSALRAIARVHQATFGGKALAEGFINDAQEAIKRKTFTFEQKDMIAALEAEGEKNHNTAKKEASQIALVTEVAMLGLPCVKAAIAAADGLPTTQRFSDRKRDNYLAAFRAVKSAMWLDENGKSIPKPQREAPAAFSAKDVTTVVTDAAKGAKAKRRTMGQSNQAKAQAKQLLAAAAFLTDMRAPPGCAKGFAQAVAALKAEAAKLTGEEE